MHALHRILVHPARRAFARLRYPKILAFLLVIVVPGGFALPLVCGLYGAIRHTLTPKGGNRSDALAETGEAAPAPVESDARV